MIFEVMLLYEITREVAVSENKTLRHPTLTGQGKYEPGMEGSMG
jgi:hypothetical protein